MNTKELYQDDERDRTAFIEYFAAFCLTSVWHEDGRLDYFVAARA